MKRIVVAILVSTSAAATSAFAAGSFEGPWVGAGMGFRGQNTKLSDNQGNEVDGIGKNNVYGVIQGGYGLRYGDFNVGPYAFYLLGNTESNTISPGGFNTFVKWKNQWGIGFQPGYFLSNDTVLYLKVGYNQTTLEVNVSSAAGQASRSDQFSGPGIGLGMKHELANHWVIFVDAQQQYYKSNTYSAGSASVEVKPKMTMGTFGFGYQF
jgi:hypothetical protein